MTCLLQFIYLIRTANFLFYHQSNNYHPASENHRNDHQHRDKNDGIHTG